MTFDPEDDTPNDARDPDAPRAVEVPYDQLDPDTLRRVIDDLVSRDGTDYGAVEKTQEQKAESLMRLLQAGKAKLVVDLATESIGLMTAEELARATR